MAKVETLADGKVTVKCDDGFSLEGLDSITATQKLAEAREDRARVASEWKQKAEASDQRAAAAEQENAALKAQQQQVQQSNQDTDQLAAWDPFVGDRLARFLKITPDQLKALPQMLGAQQKDLDEWKKEKATLSFKSKYPDFPDTDAASEALVARAEKDFEVSIEDLSAQNPQQAAAVMAAAHLSCLRDGVYKPLSAEEQNAGWTQGLRDSNRPIPPPILPGGSPETQTAETNPYAMKMDDLRKAALGQR